MAAHRARIIFHWVTFSLVAAAYLIAFWRTGIDDPGQRLFWLDCHRALGLAILTLTAMRLVGRLLLPFERIHEPNPMMHATAQLAHTAIYVLLVAMPLLGWAQSSAKMHKFKLFGVHLPALLGHNPDLGDLLGEWHEAMAWLTLGLIGLHSAAALYHHFVRKDEILLDMLRTRTVE